MHLTVLGKMLGEITYTFPSMILIKRLKEQRNVDALFRVMILSYLHTSCENDSSGWELPELFLDKSLPFTSASFPG